MSEDGFSANDPARDGAQTKELRDGAHPANGCDAAGEAAPQISVSVSETDGMLILAYQGRALHLTSEDAVRTGMLLIRMAGFLDGVRELRAALHGKPKDSGEKAA